MADPAQVRVSYAAKASDALALPGPLAGDMAWDAWWRLAYDRATKVIQEQANELLRRGNVTAEEARDLVEVRRNGLVVEMRKPLPPSASCIRGAEAAEFATHVRGARGTQGHRRGRAGQRGQDTRGDHRIAFPAGGGWS